MAITLNVFMLVMTMHCGFLMAQMINIVQMRREDCQTKCTSGLLAEFDKCSLHYSIVFKDVVPDTASLTFEIMELLSESYVPMSSLQLMSDCVGFVDGADLFCTQTASNIFNITLNTSNRFKYNEAKLRAYYSSLMKPEVYSQVQTLPRMYETTDATGTLRINGQTHSNDLPSCNKTFKSTDLALEFTCNGSAKPCVIEIHVNNSAVHRHNDYAVLKDVFKEGSDVLVVAKFAACTLEKMYNNISCRITIMQEFKKSMEQGTPKHLLAVAVIIPMVFIAVFAAAIVFFFRYRKRKEIFKSEETRVHESLLGNVKKSKRKLSNKELSVNEKDNEGWTPLMFAANSGKYEIVALLVESGADVNHKNKQGCTSLMLATQNNYVNIVSYLIENSASVNETDDQGCSALMIATVKEYTKIKDLLIKAKADVVEVKTLNVSLERKIPTSIHNRDLLMANNKLSVRNENHRMLQLTNRSVNVPEFNHSICDDDMVLSKHEAKELNLANDLKFAYGRNKTDKSETHNLNQYSSVTPFLQVARLETVSEVQHFIDRGFDVNVKDEHGMTALLAATSVGNIDVMDLLFKNQVDVNSANVNGWTALMIASQAGETIAVRCLLDNGADVELEQREGWTALMFAAYYGHYDIAEMLINKGASLNKKENNGWNALLLAFLNDQEGIVKMFIERGANVDEKDDSGGTLLMIAAQIGATKTAGILLDKGANLVERDNTRRTALMIASQNGHTETAAFLIERGADVKEKDSQGCTALITAVENGHAKTVAMLIEKGCDVHSTDEFGWTALMIASQKGFQEIVKLVIQNKAKVDAIENSGWSSLMIAAQNGHADTVELLCDSGADVNKRDGNGWAPLMIAALRGHAETVARLADKGSQINASQNDGWTPLLLATLNGHHESVRTLLRHGARMDKGTTDGLTALMLASDMGHVEIVRLILEFKC